MVSSRMTARTLQTRYSPKPVATRIKTIFRTPEIRGAANRTRSGVVRGVAAHRPRGD